MDYLLKGYVRFKQVKVYQLKVRTLISTMVEAQFNCLLTGPGEILLLFLLQVLTLSALKMQDWRVSCNICVTKFLKRSL